MKRLLSIDDHVIVVAGIEQIVSNTNDEWEIKNATNKHDAMKLLRDEDWDIVVLDISLEGKSGLEILQHIKQDYEHIPILMFSLHTGIEFVRRSLKLGAAGYVTKDSSEKQIAKAITKVVNGGRFVNEELRDELIFSRDSGNHTKLSEREFEVLILIGNGFNTKEIANQLHISVNTVDTYRARIKEKMNLTRDSYLIHYCLANGLVNIKTPL